ELVCEGNDANNPIDVTASTIELWPPNHKMKAVSVAECAEIVACDPDWTAEILWVSSDEPAEGDHDDDDCDEDDGDEDEDDDDEDDDEDDDDDDEDDDDEQPASAQPVHAARAAAAPSDWIPDWGPYAVLGLLVSVSILVGLGLVGGPPAPPEEEAAPAASAKPAASALKLKKFPSKPSPHP
ncbi:MAG TPA: hypothetical protein VJN18_16715, partial [Polyangiaceae bacterium]|nr:hypothetical protein [Polyangiaceae bacterium]